MFVVLLHYESPLAEIDRQMASHVRFLEEGYAAGIFLASGRQVPRTGGVILAIGGRADLESRMRLDPFVASGAATFSIVEFRTSLHHPALAPFADPKTRMVRHVPEPGSAAGD
jgi:uncharacterized protein YciI